MELLQNRRDELPRAGTLNAIGSWCALAKVIEGLAELGERQRTAELYPHALALRATGTRILRDAVHLVETLAGIAAAAGARWEEAEAHFEAALQQAEEVPFRSEQPEVRRWYAQMLIDRNTPGDRDKARMLIGEATEMYQMIGMPKHLEMVEKMSVAL